MLLEERIERRDLADPPPTHQHQRGRPSSAQLRVDTFDALGASGEPAAEGGDDAHPSTSDARSSPTAVTTPWWLYSNVAPRSNSTSSRSNVAHAAWKPSPERSSSASTNDESMKTRRDLTTTPSPRLPGVDERVQAQVAPPPAGRPDDRLLGVEADRVDASAGHPGGAVGSTTKLTHATSSTVAKRRMKRTH